MSENKLPPRNKHLFLERTEEAEAKTQDGVDCM